MLLIKFVIPLFHFFYEFKSSQIKCDIAGIVNLGREFFGVSQTHIFREGNQAADALASHSVLLASDTWWFDAPIFCHPFLANDFVGNHSYRFR